jgi:hypothetical protein
MSSDSKLVQCPHCFGSFEIAQLACGIFRHGSFKPPANLPDVDDMMKDLERFCWKITLEPISQNITREQLACDVRDKKITWKTNPIPSHASAADIEAWIEQDCIWGCGQPFRIVNNKPEICDFI